MKPITIHAQNNHLEEPLTVSESPLPSWRKWEKVSGLLTVDEKKAIDALKRLAKKWPDTLWIFADGNSLHVTRCGEDGERVMLSSEGVDPDMIVESVNIPNDGGDF